MTPASFRSLRPASTKDVLLRPLLTCRTSRVKASLASELPERGSATAPHLTQHVLECEDSPDRDARLTRQTTNTQESSSQHGGAPQTLPSLRVIHLTWTVTGLAGMVFSSASTSARRRAAWSASFLAWSLNITTRPLLPAMFDVRGRGRQGWLGVHPLEVMHLSTGIEGPAELQVAQVHIQNAGSPRTSARSQSSVNAAVTYRGATRQS